MYMYISLFIIDRIMMWNHYQAPCIPIWGWTSQLVGLRIDWMLVPYVWSALPSIYIYIAPPISIKCQCLNCFLLMGISLGRQKMVKDSPLLVVVVMGCCDCWWSRSPRPLFLWSSDGWRGEVWSRPWPVLVGLELSYNNDIYIYSYIYICSGSTPYRPPHSHSSSCSHVICVYCVNSWLFIYQYMSLFSWYYIY